MQIYMLYDMEGARILYVRRRHIPLRFYRNSYDENDNKLCLNCEKPVIGRRSDARYCSNNCSWDFYVKNNWRLLRMKIMRRDRFMCQKCGDRRSRVMVNGRYKRNLQVDHKMPLFKGGKEFDESNLWTLCIACHLEKTRSELKDRIAIRNRQVEQLNMCL
ncbi:MAG: HNH endonuclease signature motif containing protein [Nitrososphaerales archaeon]